MPLTTHAKARRPTQLTALLAVIVASSMTCESKPPEVYEIQAGYRGWVEVRAKRPGCAPLQRTTKATVFVIPPNGVLCTDSPIAFGWGREEFYYVKGNTRVRLLDRPAGRRSMIWNVEYYGSDGIGSGHDAQRDRIRFFVGTRDDYERNMARGHSR